MAPTLLVLPSAAGVGVARTCLGLVRALDRRCMNVGFVKPVAQLRADGGPDRSIALVAAITALRPPDPLSTAELEQQLGADGLDVVLEKIVGAVQRSAHVVSLGPMLQSLAKPVNDLSRGAVVDDIVYTLALPECHRATVPRQPRPQCPSQLGDPRSQRSYGAPDAPALAQVSRICKPERT